MRRGVGRKGRHAGGLIIFAATTDPNGGDTNLMGSGARPGPFGRTTPLSPHVSLAIAGISRHSGILPMFCYWTKKLRVFLHGRNVRKL